MKENVQKEINRSPLISTVIALYNSGRTLNRCISSIAKQTYQNWELILIDSNSTDETSQIAQKWVEIIGHGRCHYYNIAKRGHPAKRNFGIQTAQGEILFFHDSDQYLAPQTFEECLTLFNKGYDGVLIPQIEYFDDKDYLSKCSALSINLFTFGKNVLSPGMVRAEYAELMYQDEGLDWIDDDITADRFKAKGLKVASTLTSMVHDRNVPIHSLIQKTKFSVLADSRKSRPLYLKANVFSVSIKRLMKLMKSCPKYLPGVLIAILTRFITRAITILNVTIANPFSTQNPIFNEQQEKGRKL